MSVAVKNPLVTICLSFDGEVVVARTTERGGKYHILYDEAGPTRYFRACAAAAIDGVDVMLHREMPTDEYKAHLARPL